MSVIGNLDGQVNEVLIEPLKKRDEQEKTNEQRDEHSSSREIAETESAPAEKNKVERNSLPVWLL